MTEQLMNFYPDERFGIPAKADILLGTSLGEEAEVEKYIESKNEDGGYLKLSGMGDELLRVISKWSEFFDEITIKVLKCKHTYMGNRELFAAKRAYSPNFGQKNSKLEVEVWLKYDEGNGCTIEKIEYEDLHPMKIPVLLPETKDEPYVLYSVRKK